MSTLYRVCTQHLQYTTENHLCHAVASVTGTPHDIVAESVEGHTVAVPQTLEVSCHGSDNVTVDFSKSSRTASRSIGPACTGFPPFVRRPTSLFHTFCIGSPACEACVLGKPHVPVAPMTISGHQIASGVTWTRIVPRAPQRCICEIAHPMSSHGG